MHQESGKKTAQTSGRFFFRGDLKFGIIPAHRTVRPVAPWRSPARLPDPFSSGLLPMLIESSLKLPVRSRSFSMERWNSRPAIRTNGTLCCAPTPPPSADSRACRIPVSVTHQPSRLISGTHPVSSCVPSPNKSRVKGCKLPIILLCDYEFDVGSEKIAFPIAPDRRNPADQQESKWISLTFWSF